MNTTSKKSVGAQAKQSSFVTDLENYLTLNIDEKLGIHTYTDGNPALASRMPLPINKAIPIIMREEDITLMDDIIPPINKYNDMIDKVQLIAKKLQDDYIELHNELSRLEQNLNDLSLKGLSEINRKIKEYDELTMQFSREYIILRKSFSVYTYKFSKINNTFEKDKLTATELENNLVFMYSTLVNWPDFGFEGLSLEETEQIEQSVVPMIKKELSKDKLADLLKKSILPSHIYAQTPFLISEEDYENAYRLLVTTYIYYNYDLLCQIRRQYHFVPQENNSTYQLLSTTLFRSVLQRQILGSLLSMHKLRVIEIQPKLSYDPSPAVNNIRRSRCCNYIEQSKNYHINAFRTNLKNINDEDKLHKNLRSKLSTKYLSLQRYFKKRQAQEVISLNKLNESLPSAASSLGQAQTLAEENQGFSAAEERRRKSKEKRDLARQNNASAGASNSSTQPKPVTSITSSVPTIRETIRSALNNSDNPITSNLESNTMAARPSIEMFQPVKIKPKKPKAITDTAQTSVEATIYNPKFQQYYIKYALKQEEKEKKIMQLQQDFPGIPILSDLQVMPDEDTIEEMAYYEAVKRCEVEGLPFPEKNPNLPPPENKGYTIEDHDEIVNRYCRLEGERLKRKAMKICMQRHDDLDLPPPVTYEKQDLDEALKLSNSTALLLLCDREGKQTNVLLDDDGGYLTNPEAANEYGSFLKNLKEIEEKGQRGWIIEGDIRTEGGCLQTILRVKTGNIRLFCKEAAIVINPHNADIMVVFTSWKQINRGQEGQYENLYDQLNQRGLNNHNSNPLIQNNMDNVKDSAYIELQKKRFMEGRQGRHAKESVLYEIYEAFHNESSSQSIMDKRNEIMRKTV